MLPRSICRYILVSNHLPVKASRENEDAGWNFELDVDALVVQAKARNPAPCPPPSLHTEQDTTGSPINQFGHVLACAIVSGHQHSAVSQVSSSRLCSHIKTPAPYTFPWSLVGSLIQSYASRSSSHMTLAAPQEGIDEEYQIMYVGSLSVEVDPMDQDVRPACSASSELRKAVVCLCRPGAVVDSAAMMVALSALRPAGRAGHHVTLR